MSATCTRPYCRRRPSDAFVCSRCADELRDALTGKPDPENLGVGALVADLQTAMNRSSRVAAASGAASSESPMPFGWHAAEAGWVLASVIGTWVRLLCEERAMPLPLFTLGRRPGQGRREWIEPRSVLRDSQVVDLAEWLAWNVEAVRQSEYGGQLVDEVTSAVFQARRAVDGPPPREFLGTCDRCDTELYVTDRTAVEIDCPGCGWSYGVENRRRRVEQRVRGHLGTASEVAGLLGELLGIKVTVQKISMWKSRSKLMTKGQRDGHDLLLVGDVLDMARFSAPRRSE